MDSAKYTEVCAAMEALQSQEIEAASRVYRALFDLTYNIELLSSEETLTWLYNKLTNLHTIAHSPKNVFLSGVQELLNNRLTIIQARAFETRLKVGGAEAYNELATLGQQLEKSMKGFKQTK